VLLLPLVVVAVDVVDELVVMLVPVVLLTLVLVVPLVLVADTVLLAVVVRTPMQIYSQSREGTAASGSDCPKYTAELSATYTQVNGKGQPV
jgi:hypothetical protein